jgi:hypothetical protein
LYPSVGHFPIAPREVLSYDGYVLAWFERFMPSGPR